MHDYVVVGAGSAGCVLAARLSKDQQARVLLLEAGGSDKRNEIRIPAAFSKLFKSDVDWDYATEPEPELDDRRIYWPRGKALGGCSSINAMMAIPGHRADYDGWAALGATGWSYAETAPFFERVFDTLGVEELRILAGGTVNSPQLLLLSGIGPTDELARHGIPLVHELPGVGAHLEDHLSSGILVESRKPLSLYAAERPLQLVRYLLMRKGMLTSNVAEAAAFVRSRPELPAPDLELLFAPVLFEEGGLAPPRAHGFTIGAILLQPRSSGVLRLRSSDPFEAPSIEARYLSDAGGADLRTLVTGVELARRILSMPALAELAGVELEPGELPLVDEIRAKAQTLYHPVGTCRMGTDDFAVVDPELRVHGIEGLRVVDASVMPRVPRGHTHLPTLMIAERAAQLIRAGSGLAEAAVSVPA